VDPFLLPGRDCFAVEECVERLRGKVREAIHTGVSRLGVPSKASIDESHNPKRTSALAMTCQDIDQLALRALLTMVFKHMQSQDDRAPSKTCKAHR